MALKKSDLIKILVDEYGYEKEDLKFDAEGKPYTNAKLQALIDAEKQEAEELEKAKEEAKKPVTRVQAKKSAIADNEKILVMNGLTGALYYKSERTNSAWEFEDFGQQDVMEYSELKIMRNRYPRYFKEGWLIVLDPEVQKEFGLTEMYNHIITPDNADDVFSMNVEELEKFIDALPDGMKSSFVNMAQERVEDRRLDSKTIIDMIENKFNFSFDDNAPKDDIVSTREKVGNGIIIVDKK
ncbi:MAG: hypothetical protein ABS939_08510 [Psychrobacillus sp.]